MGHKVLTRAVRRRHVQRATLKRPGQGFTLIEMLVTITILLLLIAMGAPAYGAWLQNTQLRSAAEGVQNGLQIARQAAVQMNNKVQISFAGADWSVSVLNPAQVLQSRTNSGLTPNAQLSPSQSVVVFNGLGQVSPPPVGVITVAVSNPVGGTCRAAGGPIRCLNVTVQAGGQIRMCDPALPTTDPQSC